MNKIDLQIQKIKQKKRIGLMLHIVVGYPNLKTCEELIKEMDRLYVDFVELQIPFSDPLADGPTMMEANRKARQKNVNTDDALELMEKLSSQVSMPLLFMGYYNTIFNYGVKEFCKKAAAGGASGIIIPDYPVEDPDGLIEECVKNNLYFIPVLSPASTKDRIKLNTKSAKGFIYFAGRKGITGEKQKLDPELNRNLKKINKLSNLPLAVGFGISKKEHIQALKGKSQIAVIGSALINRYKNSADAIEELTKFVSEIT